MTSVKKDQVDAVVEAWAKELPGVIGVELALSKRAGRVAGLLAAEVDAELVRFGLTKAEERSLVVVEPDGPRDSPSRDRLPMKHARRIGYIEHHGRQML